MNTRRRIATTVGAAALLLSIAALGSAAAASPAGAVYTESNQAAGNAVLIWSRAADGSLTPAPSVATGGLGTGAGLGR